MTSDGLQHRLDLRRAVLDPDLAAALVVQHNRRLIAAGGNGACRLDVEEALTPHQLDAFLVRAVETASTTRRFEQERYRLQRLVPQIQAAWERGQALFQEDVVRATSNPEEMESLSQIDFTLDCYAAVDARKAYPHNRCSRHALRADICWRGGSTSLRRKMHLSQAGLRMMIDSLCGCVRKRQEGMPGIVVMFIIQ